MSVVPPSWQAKLSYNNGGTARVQVYWTLRVHITIDPCPQNSLAN